MIDGVVLKSLDTHQDERRFFREIIRETDDFFQEGFGPWSHSLMYPGVIKAWHIHKKQTDWWYVSTGVLKIVLYDKRPESATYRQNMERMLGDGYDPSILKTPPGCGSWVQVPCRPSQSSLHHFSYLRSGGQRSYSPR